MVEKPKLSEYSLNVLVTLGNQTVDEFSRSKIKIEIVQKLLEFNYSMFRLVNAFRLCNGILKEAYADVILMNMKGNYYYIDNTIVDEILAYASYDALMYYGADSKSYEFNLKCKEEFYKRGDEIEDKIELQRKKTLGKKLMINFCDKKKGDRK